MLYRSSVHIPVRRLTSALVACLVVAACGFIYPHAARAPQPKKRKTVSQ